jgi:hypothetical protein
VLLGTVTGMLNFLNNETIHEHEQTLLYLMCSFNVIKNWHTSQASSNHRIHGTVTEQFLKLSKISTLGNSNQSN